VEAEEPERPANGESRGERQSESGDESRKEDASESWRKGSDGNLERNDEDLYRFEGSGGNARDFGSTMTQWKPTNNPNPRAHLENCTGKKREHRNNNKSMEAILVQTVCEHRQ
jgi:hypothetical protein